MIGELFGNVAGDVRRGWSVPFGDLAVAALVVLPFSFALTLLVNAAVWWPSAVMVVLAGLVQGVGTFWNAGWRARTALRGEEE